jgi:hypothetical protein
VIVELIFAVVIVGVEINPRVPSPLRVELRTGCMELILEINPKVPRP